MTVPDEVVEYVFNAYRANVAWEGTEAECWDRFRVAFVASGAVFLTDEERLDVLSAIARQHEYFDKIGVKHTFLSVLEKLA